MPPTVSVLLPIPVERPYTYRWEAQAEPVPGQIVQVPLGNRQVAGCIWAHAPDDVAPDKLKPVSHVFDCPPLTESLQSFIVWVARYTLSPPGMVLRMVLRAPGAYEPLPPHKALRFTGLEPERMTAARNRVLSLARDGGAWTKSGLAHAAGVSNDTTVMACNV